MKNLWDRFDFSLLLSQSGIIMLILRLLFAAETLLAVSLFELNKEKKSDEGYTHGEMVRGLFHTRCQVRVKNHKGNISVKQLHLILDVVV